VPRKARTGRRSGPSVPALRAEVQDGGPWVHGGSTSDVLNELVYGHSFFGESPGAAELEDAWAELRGDILAGAKEHGADKPAAWWWEHGKEPPTPLADSVHAYAREVVAGKILASKWVCAACARHLDDLERGADRGLRWDAGKAERAMLSIAMLVLWKGVSRGQRMHLDPWHRFIVGSLFGWTNRAGRRRFGRAYVEVARGQAKSHLAAAILVQATFLEGEGGAEGYCAATKKDQAKIVLDVARRMIQKSPILESKLEVMKREILRDTSVAVAVSKEYDSLDGLDPHVAIIDELHAHPSRGVLDVLEEGARKRAQSIVFMITTAGDGDAGQTVCRDERDYCTSMLQALERNEDPAPMDHVFAYIACLDTKADGAKADDDWRDEANWIKANPSLGHLVGVDELRKARDDALRLPTRQTSFKRKHCNLWVGTPDSWLEDGAWSACAAPPDSIDLSGLPCWGGLDLSKRIDLTAFVLCFPLEDGRFAFLSRFWMPEDRVREREDRDRKPYRTWIEQGHIVATPGNVVDYAWAKKQIRADAEEFALLGIGFDPYQSWKLAPELQDEGYALAEIHQGPASLSEPMKELEALILGRKVVHFANPVMDWNVGCVKARTDVNENIAPDKKRSTGKIDGVLGAIMSLRMASAQEKEKAPEPAFHVV